MLRRLQFTMNRLMQKAFPEDARPQWGGQCPDRTDRFISITAGMGALTGAISANGRLYMVGHNHWGGCGVGSAKPEIVYRPLVPVAGMSEQPAGPLAPLLAPAPGALLSESAARLGPGSALVPQTAVTHFADGLTRLPRVGRAGVISYNSIRDNNPVPRDAPWTFGSLIGGAHGWHDPDEEDRPVPLHPVRDPVVQTAVGMEFALAVTRSGALYGWGRNDRGQSGIGDTDPYKQPSRVLGPREVFLEEGVVAVASSWAHGACVTNWGRLYVWGKYMSLAERAPVGPSGSFGMVMADQLFPRRVDIPPPDVSYGPDALMVGAGGAGRRRPAWLDPSHGVRWGGHPRLPPLPDGETAAEKDPCAVVAVTAGMAHLSLITADGRLFMLGQRGKGRENDASVRALEGLDIALRGIRNGGDGGMRAAFGAPALPAIEAHGSTALRVERTRELLDSAWLPAAQAAAAAGGSWTADELSGEDKHKFAGERPIPPVYSQTVPLEIPPGPLAGRTVVKLKSDAHYSYAITSDGMVWRWGWKGIVLPVLNLLHLDVADASWGWVHGVVLARELN